MAAKPLPPSLRRNPAAVKLSREVASLKSRNRSLRDRVSSVPSASATIATVQAGAAAGGFFDEVLPDIGPADTPTTIGIGIAAIGWWTGSPVALNFAAGVLAPQSADLGRMLGQRLLGATGSAPAAE